MCEQCKPVTTKTVVVEGCTRTVKVFKPVVPDTFVRQYLRAPGNNRSGHRLPGLGHYDRQRDHESHIPVLR